MKLRIIEICLWVTSGLLLGAYVSVYLDRSFYQSYQTWAFDQRLQHEPAPVLGFLWHTLRFGDSETKSADPPNALASTAVSPEPAAPPLAEGTLLGRIEIPAADVHAMIVNGTTDESLRHAVGHIDGTAMPGSLGNVGLAGHRDTFFRGLRHLERDDVITIQTLDGRYDYEVVSTEIVDPGDVQVLGASDTPMLTLVTCYPFNYVGSAPQRYIVHAREIGTTPPAPRGS